MTKLLIISLSALLAGSAAPAQISSASLKWMAGPPGLPKSSTFAVLSGDPAKEGLFTIRARFPAGYIVPPHHHPTDELLTVLSGQMAFGMGPKLERPKMKTMVTGSYMVVEANMNHYVVARAATTLQITAQGPFAITYVNPADDPRHR